MAFTPKLTYKGLPLVRCGNELYFGSLADPCVIYLQILNTKQEDGMEVADKVHVVLMSTDSTKPLRERIIKQSTKTGLYAGLEFGYMMLERHSQTAKNAAPKKK